VCDFHRLDTPQAWQGTLVTGGFSGYTATTTKERDLGSVQPGLILSHQMTS
jgi:hypothetical protein